MRVRLLLVFVTGSLFLQAQESPQNMASSVFIHTMHLDSINSALDPADTKSLESCSAFLDYTTSHDYPDGTIKALTHILRFYVMRDMSVEASKIIEEYTTEINRATDREALAGLEMNIGVLHLNNTNYQEATSYFEKAGQHYMNVKDSVGLSNYLTNISFVYSEIGKMEKAIDYLKRSITIDSLLGNEDLLGGQYHNLGTYYIEPTGPNTQAIAYLNKALQYSEIYKNDVFKGRHYLCLAELYTLRKEYDKALDLLLESLVLSDASDDYGTRVGGLVLMGSIYAETISHTQALSPYKKALELAQQENLSQHEVTVHELLADTYTELGDEQSAKIHHAEKLEILADVSKSSQEALEAMD